MSRFRVIQGGSPSRHRPTGRIGRWCRRLLRLCPNCGNVSLYRTHNILHVYLECRQCAAVMVRKRSTIARMLAIRDLRKRDPIVAQMMEQGLANRKRRQEDAK